MTRREALAGALVIERKPGYLKVWHARAARDVVEAREVLDAMDGAIRDWELTRLLFDSRDADATPPAVAALIWSWLAEHRHITRVATLVQSEQLADNINLGSVGEEVRIRAFHTEPSAVRWLTLLN